MIYSRVVPFDCKLNLAKDGVFNNRVAIEKVGARRATRRLTVAQSAPGCNTNAPPAKWHYLIIIIDRSKQATLAIRSRIGAVLDNDTCAVVIVAHPWPVVN